MIYNVILSDYKNMQLLYNTHGIISYIFHNKYKH